MNPLLDLIPEVTAFLNTAGGKLVHDLGLYINRENENPNLAMFWFIHFHEDFGIAVISMDKQSKVITDVVGLPTADYDNAYSLKGH